MKNIDVLILCGGKGKRLKKISGGIPEPMVRIRDRITEYGEKNHSLGSLVNTGVYLFQKDALSLLPHNTKYSLEKDFFPKLAGKNIFGFINEKQFIDIGTPERYELAKKVLGT